MNKYFPPHIRLRKQARAWNKSFKIYLCNILRYDLIIIVHVYEVPFYSVLRVDDSNYWLIEYWYYSWRGLRSTWNKFSKIYEYCAIGNKTTIQRCKHYCFKLTEVVKKALKKIIHYTDNDIPVSRLLITLNHFYEIYPSLLFKCMSCNELKIINTFPKTLSYNLENYIFHGLEKLSKSFFISRTPYLTFPVENRLKLVSHPT